MRYKTVVDVIDRNPIRNALTGFLNGFTRVFYMRGIILCINA